MYGTVLGASTIVPSAAGVILLPDTGTYRFMFIVSAIALAIGTVTLIVSGISAMKRRHQS